MGAPGFRGPALMIASLPAILASSTGNLGLAMLGLIAAFIVMLVARRKRLERGIVAFRIQRRLRPGAALPAGLHAALGAARWNCWEGSLASARGPVPYFWLEGYTTSSQLINSVPSTSISPLVAIALPASVVDERLLAAIAEAREKASWWKEQLFRNAQSPVRAERVDGDVFLLVWTVCWNPKHYEKALSWVERALAGEPLG